MGEELLCLREFVISHLSERERALNWERGGLVSCCNVTHPAATDPGFLATERVSLSWLFLCSIYPKNLWVQLFWHHLQPFLKSPGMLHAPAPLGHSCASHGPQVLC